MRKLILAIITLWFVVWVLHVIFSYTVLSMILMVPIALIGGL